MKKILAAAICSLPFALAPTVYAQTTTEGGAATGAPPSTSANASPDASTTPRAADTGAAMTPSTTAPTGATGTATDSAAMAATAASTDWSVRGDMIGESVFNENDDKVGDVTDLLVSHDGKLTAFVVGAGGFLGMGEHNVAIPFDRVTKSGDKLILAGYTKEQLKELPKYERPQKARDTDRSITTGTSGNPGTSGTPANPVTPAPGSTTDTSPPPSTTR